MAAPPRLARPRVPDRLGSRSHCNRGVCLANQPRTLSSGCLEATGTGGNCLPFCDGAPSKGAALRVFWVTSPSLSCLKPRFLGANLLMAPSPPSQKKVLLPSGFIYSWREWLAPSIGPLRGGGCWVPPEPLVTKQEPGYF